MKQNQVVDGHTYRFNTVGFASRLLFIAMHVRKSIFKLFEEQTKITENDTVLDVGVSADGSIEDVNFFEKWYKFKDKITAVSLANTSCLENIYPGLKSIVADGKALPFKDRSFDFVFSSAVIEHVGSHTEQTKFIKECVRVAKKGVFITTPNRWFPIELHVLWPFVHWLPPKFFRKVLLLMKKEPLNLEENLNLISCSRLKRSCLELFIEKYSITRHKLLGFTSNLILYIPIIQP